MLFRILFGIAALAAAVVLFFFFWGVSDGTVSSFNIGIWIALLAAALGIPAAGWLLNAKGYRGAACALLLVAAIPALLFALFFLFIVIAQPRWN